MTEVRLLEVTTPSLPFWFVVWHTVMYPQIFHQFLEETAIKVSHVWVAWSVVRGSETKTVISTTVRAIVWASKCRVGGKPRHVRTNSSITCFEVLQRLNKGFRGSGGNNVHELLTHYIISVPEGSEHDFACRRRGPDLVWCWRALMLVCQ
jgi:hypothetical protein